jgi:hypothetical protein
MKPLSSSTLLNDWGARLAAGSNDVVVRPLPEPPDVPGVVPGWTGPVPGTSGVPGVVVEHAARSSMPAKNKASIGSLYCVFLMVDTSLGKGFKG